MAWKIKDQWIDLQQAQHVILFHNPDTGQEHALVNPFKLQACPHCGHVKESQSQPGDFQKVADKELASLNDHHAQVMRYRERFPRVRIGNGPLK